MCKACCDIVTPADVSAASETTKRTSEGLRAAQLLTVMNEIGQIHLLMCSDRLCPPKVRYVSSSLISFDSFSLKTAVIVRHRSPPD